MVLRLRIADSVLIGRNVGQVGRFRFDLHRARMQRVSVTRADRIAVSCIGAISRLLADPDDGDFVVARSGRVLNVLGLGQIDRSSGQTTLNLFDIRLGCRQRRCWRWFRHNKW